MARLSVNPRRDLEKPVVEIDPTAPLWKRLAAWLLRSYLILAAIIALLAGLAAVVLLLSL